MKKSLTLLLIILVITLTGCSRDNPLLTQNSDKISQQLYQAENKASQATYLYDATNSVYLTCLTNPHHYDSPFNQNGKSLCKKFFKSMLYFLKQNKNLTNLTFDDLTDQQIVTKLSKKLTNLNETDGQGDD